MVRNLWATSTSALTTVLHSDQQKSITNQLIAHQVPIDYLLMST